MMVRGLRGATTVEHDEEQAVLEATEALGQRNGEGKQHFA